MLKQNKNQISWKLSVIIILIIIIDITFLYFIKYNNQKLTLNDFNLFITGNILNIIFALIVIVGVLTVKIKKNLTLEIRYFLPVFIINQFLLVFCFAVTIIDLPFAKIYYLGQNGNQLFVGLIFTLYQFTYFVILFIVWFNILSVKSIVVLRAAINSAIIMSVTLVITFLFILGSEDSFKGQNLNNHGNYFAVVLGAAVWSDNKPSPSLAARVDKAMELLKSHIVNKIYLTGSNAPGELSEAEVALNYIKSKHVNYSEIFIEKETTSTNEQIQFIKEKLLSNPDENVIVVSDSYHLVRVKEISKFHNIEIKVLPSDLNLSFKAALNNKIREALALTVFWFFAI
jgi:vancomycin permeability regulator SanA